MLLRATIFAMVFVFCVPGVFAAATWTVTTTADENDGECVADCTLREAIAVAANGDKIVFSPATAGGTILLAASLDQLVIDKELSIFGTGAGESRIKIDGGGQIRVFRIRRNITVKMDNLIIQNGFVPNILRPDGTAFVGAGIFSQGFLSLRNIDVKNSFANTAGGGIFSDEFAQLELTSCLVSNNSVNNTGGGIFAGGRTVLNKTIIRQNTAVGLGGGSVFSVDAVVTDSQVSENTAGQGGGLEFFSGPATVIRSTISNNTANRFGGGGIDHASGTLNLINSTVSGNSSVLWGGGIFCGQSILNVRNSTITNNTVALAILTGGPSPEQGGGGIGMLLGENRPQTVTLGNTIIAGNRLTGMANPGLIPAPDILIVDGGIISNGNNLIGDTTHSTGWLASDILNQNARLAPLANNGGQTLTHAPARNSPAINAGNNALAVDLSTNNPLATDQRGVGFSRIIGNTVDIGAFEFSPRSAQFDFDGDGKSDISVFRPSNGAWYLLQSTAGFSAIQFGVSTDKLVPGDFTGDGRSDIAVFRPATGEWFIQRSEDNSFFSFPFGTSGDIPVATDFDGDGKTDPGVFRPSNSTWFISKSSGGTLILQFGTSGDQPVAADYDGDGRTDVAIFRPSDGSWWYVRSSDNQFRVFSFGVSTDKPVQGDYTGDGKADIAIFRPSTGEWFIQRSEDNSYFSFPFGATGDLPVPGDYDGDGKFDPAVFRPSSSTWFINRTTAGILITNFGTTGDRPIPNVFVP